jgi:hypothetical protein
MLLDIHPLDTEIPNTDPEATKRVYPAYPIATPMTHTHITEHCNPKEEISWQ